MKISLFLAFLYSTFSFAKPTICRNLDTSAEKETFLILEGQSLMAICQRSTIQGLQNFSNEEICADDDYILTSSPSGTLGSVSAYLSTKARVTFTFSVDSKGIKAAFFSSNYEAKTLSGTRKVSVPVGRMYLKCN